MGKWLAGIVAVTLAGCASGPPINTPSGSPEITLSNVRVDCVKGAFLNALLNKGYRIEQSSDYVIVVGKPTDNTMAALLYGSGLNAIPEERLRMTMITQSGGSGLRIVFDGAYVTNPGTAFEKLQPMQENANTQRQLESVAPAIESKCANT